MKRLLIAFALLTIFATMSIAEVQDFSEFSIDVATGWTAKRIDKKAVEILERNNFALITIITVQYKGMTFKNAAEQCMKELKGKNLKREDVNMYSFQYKQKSNVEVGCFVIPMKSKKGSYALLGITVSDNAPKKTDDEIEAMLDSFHTY